MSDSDSETEPTVQLVGMTPEQKVAEERRMIDSETIFRPMTHRSIFHSTRPVNDPMVILDRVSNALRLTCQRTSVRKFRSVAPGFYDVDPVALLNVGIDNFEGYCLVEYSNHGPPSLPKSQSSWRQSIVDCLHSSLIPTMIPPSWLPPKTREITVLDVFLLVAILCPAMETTLQSSPSPPLSTENNFLYDPRLLVIDMDVWRSERPNDQQYACRKAYRFLSLQLTPGGSTTILLSTRAGDERWMVVHRLINMELLVLVDYIKAKTTVLDVSRLEKFDLSRITTFVSGYPPSSPLHRHNGQHSMMFWNLIRKQLGVK